MVERARHDRFDGPLEPRSARPEPLDVHRGLSAGLHRRLNGGMLGEGDELRTFGNPAAAHVGGHAAQRLVEPLAQQRFPRPCRRLRQPQTDAGEREPGAEQDDQEQAGP